MNLFEYWHFFVWAWKGDVENISTAKRNEQNYTTLEKFSVVEIKTACQSITILHLQVVKNQ